MRKKNDTGKKKEEANIGIDFDLNSPVDCP